MRERRELAVEKKGEEGRKKGSRGYMGRANHAIPFGVIHSRQTQWRDTSRYLTGSHPITCATWIGVAPSLLA